MTDATKKKFSWRWVLIAFFLLGGIGSIFSNPVIGIVLFSTAIVLLPQFSKFLNKKFNIVFSTKSQIITIIILFVVFGSISVATTPVPKQTATTKQTIQTTTTSSPATPKTDQQVLEDSLKDIISKFSKTVPMESLSYNGLSVTNDDPDRPAGTKIVSVIVNYGNCTDKKLCQMASGELSSQIYQAVFPSKINAYDVAVLYYGDVTDRYGKTSNEAILVNSIDKDTYNKINWPGFDENNLCTFLRQEGELEQGSGSDGCSGIASVQ